MSRLWNSLFIYLVVFCEGRRVIFIAFFSSFFQVEAAGALVLTTSVVGGLLLLLLFPLPFPVVPEMAGVAFVVAAV